MYSAGMNACRSLTFGCPAQRRRCRRSSRPVEPAPRNCGSCTRTGPASPVTNEQRPRGRASQGQGKGKARPGQRQDKGKGRFLLRKATETLGMTPAVTYTREPQTRFRREGRYAVSCVSVAEAARLRSGETRAAHQCLAHRCCRVVSQTRQRHGVVELHPSVFL